MITVLDLAQITGKSENVIRYWIKKDKKFAEKYWKLQKIEIRNRSGWYEKEMQTCKEEDIAAITKYLNSKKTRKLSAAKCWSDLAIHCYERKLTCDGCIYYQYCREFSEPPMKIKVKELLEKYGEPR